MNTSDTVAMIQRQLRAERNHASRIVIRQRPVQLRQAEKGLVHIRMMSIVVTEIEHQPVEFRIPETEWIAEGMCLTPAIIAAVGQRPGLE